MASSYHNHGKRAGGGGGGGKDDGHLQDLALPLGMSFAAIVAQVSCSLLRLCVFWCQLGYLDSKSWRLDALCLVFDFLSSCLPMCIRFSYLFHCFFIIQLIFSVLTDM